MANKPILIFPKARLDSYSKKPSYAASLIFPSKEQQIERLEKKLTDIETAFKNHSLQFADSIEGLIPEMILIFEIAGTINEFFKAVNLTPGMHYLLEYQDDYLKAASGFFYRDPQGNLMEREVERRVFVTLNNQNGIRQLLSYWRSFKLGRIFERGVGKFRYLFSQLNDIRLYNVSDRIKDTGFERYLLELRESAADWVNFEVELAFHDSNADRSLIIQEINASLLEVGGNILPQSVTSIPEIRYFGAVARAPMNVFDDLSSNTDVVFLKSHRILFFKPVGQIISKSSEREQAELEDGALQSNELSNQEPIVSLFDGMPMQNHKKLQERLVVDDPEDFSTNYLPEQRLHGTGMASLIIYGDFDRPGIIKSKLYVRPILKLNDTGGGQFEEGLPKDRLIIDIIHRAIKRMMEGDSNTAPTAPGVKIVNFSIADEFRPYMHILSSWSKLLDYLSDKFKILFIISAGNYQENITLKISAKEFEGMSSSEREQLIYLALFEKNFERKILTPGESVNNLTVGGFHYDSSKGPAIPGKFNPNVAHDLPSPISRIGYGFNRSLKPELIFDSGRVIYRIVGSGEGKIELKIANGFTVIPPGIKVASPGRPGDINKISYSVGTSHSAALVTNKACMLYEALEEINRLQIEERKPAIPRIFYAVIIKALLIHYSECEALTSKLEDILKNIPGITPKIIKEYIYQNIGYGYLNQHKLGFCTDQRVTLLGFGKLKKDEAHIYRFPLPDILSGKKLEKKLSITLGWFSPVNFDSGKYKMAQLYIDNIKRSQNDLFLDRSGADIYTSRRGTVLHDILTNESADVYLDGSELAIKISCREDASGLKTRMHTYEIGYALAVSLELNESSQILIYDEIKTRISQRVKVGI